MIETRRLMKSVHTTEGLLTILKGIDLRVTEGEVLQSLALQAPENQLCSA